MGIGHPFGSQASRGSGPRKKGRDVNTKTGTRWWCVRQSSFSPVIRNLHIVRPSGSRSLLSRMLVVLALCEFGLV
jgi:hypothetical protein